MKLYLKGFYGYKNFGDEMLFFGLLNYLQKEYNPESFTVEVGDKTRIQGRIQTNKSYLDNGILDKLDFVENAVVSKRFRQIQSLIGLDKYKKYFKVFGGGEVLDESRKFPHNGWNLFLLHNYSIRNKNFILVGGIGTDKKESTKELYKYLLPRAKKIICREEGSTKIAKKYVKNNVILHKDFSESVISTVPLSGESRAEETRSIGEVDEVKKVNCKTRNTTLGCCKAREGDLGLKSLLTKKGISRKTGHSRGQLGQEFVLINVGPKYYTKENINKIKEFLKTKIAASQTPRNYSIKKIFFPADINFDKEFYPKLRKIIPDLEIYDRTKHSLSETLSLFKNCSAGIGSRLHFLYPLKIFKKDFVSISDSDKVRKMIPHPNPSPWMRGA